jgi:hypothetical protein
MFGDEMGDLSKTPKMVQRYERLAEIRIVAVEDGSFKHADFDNKADGRLSRQPSDARRFKCTSQTVVAWKEWTLISVPETREGKTDLIAVTRYREPKCLVSATLCDFTGGQGCRSSEIRKMAGGRWRLMPRPGRTGYSGSRGLNEMCVVDVPGCMPATWWEWWW